MDIQHVPERLSSQGWIGICQLCYPPDVVDTVDILRDPRSGDIPIVVFQNVQVDKGDRDVPVFAVGGVG
jgi:hypothetical protein